MILIEDIVNILNHIESSSSSSLSLEQKDEFYLQYDEILNCFIFHLDQYKQILSLLHQYNDGTIDIKLINNSSYQFDNLFIRNKRKRIRLSSEIDIIAIHPKVMEYLSMNKPITTYYQELYHHHYYHGNNLKTISCQANNCLNNINISLDTILKQLPIELSNCLHPHQKESLLYAIQRYGRVLLADEMGLGKSLQAIAIATYYIKEWPLLIVCPSSLKYNWKYEILKWLPMINEIDIQIINSKTELIDKNKCITIINYELLSSLIITNPDHQQYQQAINPNDHLSVKSKLEKVPYYQVIIVDESHYFKNKLAKRSKLLIPKLIQASRVILLSGTPTLAKPMELYTQVHVLQPNLLGTYQQFLYRYGNIPQAYITNNIQSYKAKQLHLLLKKFVLIRRLKSDILINLPPKYRRNIIYQCNNLEKIGQLSIDIQNIKKMMKNKVHQFFINNKAQQQVTANDDEKQDEQDEQEEQDLFYQNHPKILGLYQQTGIIKVEYICDYITKQLELKADQKLIVFVHHRIVMNSIALYLKKQYQFIQIDGSCQSINRQILVDQFQKDLNDTNSFIIYYSCWYWYYFNLIFTYYFW